MKEDVQDNLPFEDRKDEEGMFDAQVMLPLASTPWAAPVQEVIKRDGQREPFEKDKIAAAILQAATAEGALEFDAAQGIASAVAIYLAKRLRGQPATTDQINDAVERVLIQMAQIEAALAFTRFRERRTRARQLHKRDSSVASGGIEGMGHIATFLAREKVLHMPASQDKVIEWDRNRIIEILQLETGMAATLAASIASEVENQIQAAGITTLTAPLIRELVSAKLVDRGLVQENAHRRKLNMPLHEVSRIILGRTESTINSTPTATGTTLARAVKKEYALTEVFSSSVAEAHWLGQIHLNELEFVDRLHTCELSCKSALSGSCSYEELPETSLFADSALVNVNLILKRYDFLQTFFARSMGWCAFNFLAAPFFKNKSDREMQVFSRLFLVECANRKGGLAQWPMRVSIHWNIPEALADSFVTGLDASYDGITYKSLEPVARRLFWALLEANRAGDVNGTDFQNPILEVVCGAGLFQTFEGNAGLLQAARAAVERPNIRFVLKDTRFDDHRKDSDPQGEYHDIVWHRVALNLPRAAVTSADKGAFWVELDRLCTLAVKAHIEKRNFIQGMLDPAGCAPLAPLTRAGLQRSTMATERGIFMVDIDGLSECAETLIVGGHATLAEQAQFMVNVISHLDVSLKRLADREGIHCVLGANSNPQVSAGFADTDVSLFPDLVDTIIKTDRSTQALTYTSGVGLPNEKGLSPFEMARIEGILHKRLAGRLFTSISMPMKHASENTLIDLLKKVFHQTHCKGLVLFHRGK